MTLTDAIEEAKKRRQDLIDNGDDEWNEDRRRVPVWRLKFHDRVDEINAWDEAIELMERIDANANG